MELHQWGVLEDNLDLSTDEGQRRQHKEIFMAANLHFLFS